MGPTFRWFAAGDLDDPGFAGTVHFPRTRGFVAKFLVQRRVEAPREKRFADVEHGEGVTPDNLGNLRIRFVSMEQDVHMPDRGGGRFATANKAFEERTLVVGKGNGVLALHHEGCIQHGTI